MSSSYITTTLTSGLRLLRRNAGKIALITFAGAGAVAAVTYVRRQYRVVNDTLEAERTDGARKLRTAFVATSHTLSTTFRALLPRLGTAIAACPITNASSALARLREKPTDRAEKAALWETVRVASLTALLAMSYLSATLHATLTLQLNLLARYAGASPDAPVQTLPAGSLQSYTSKHFLEVAGHSVIGTERVSAIVSTIADAVRSQLSDIRLSDIHPLAVIEERLHAVLSSIADGERDETPPPTLATSALFREPDENVFNDPNLVWLSREALDLCEVLHFDDVVTSCAGSALITAMSHVRSNLLTGGASADGVPLAQLLARLASAATHMTADGDGADALEAALRADEFAMHFGAAVFLSGEKESDERGTAATQRESDVRHTSVEQGPSEAQPLEPINGRDRSNREGSGDNLGLMYDMVNADRDPSDLTD